MRPGLRILQVITDPDRRGAQVFAHDLGAELAARGHTVTTVALAPGRGAGAVLDAEVLGGGVRDPRALRALRRRMADADVTIAHGSSTGPACALAGGGRTRPFVYRQISDSRFWAPTRSRRLRVRLALSRARLVVALSELHRRQLTDWIGVRADRTRIVPNGVSPDRFAPTTPEARRAARVALGVPDGPTLAFVGALSAEKGADRAIEVLPSLPDDTRLLIAGDGPDRAALESLAQRVAPGRVRFLGAVADVAPVYRAVDVIVCPSRSDAMPGAVIEAGLSGVPVVATAVGALPEMVLDGETGVVVPAEGVDNLGGAVGALLVDPDRRERLGVAARAHCLSRYAIEPVAAAWEQVLREAVSGPGG